MELGKLDGSYAGIIDGILDSSDDGILETDGILVGIGDGASRTEIEFKSTKSELDDFASLIIIISFV